MEQPQKQLDKFDGTYDGEDGEKTNQLLQLILIMGHLTNLSFIWFIKFNEWYSD